MNAAAVRALACGLIYASVVVILGLKSAQANEFSFRNAQFRVINGVINMDADVDLPLTEAAREALSNGVTLTVVIESEVRAQRALLWDESIANIRAIFAIEYHALSDQYVLRNVNLGLTQSYTNLGALRAELGRIRAFPLIGVSRLAADQDHSVRIQARLDIESLPAPLRPLAYLSTRWRVSSDWYEWALRW